MCATEASAAARSKSTEIQANWGVAPPGRGGARSGNIAERTREPLEMHAGETLAMLDGLTGPGERHNLGL
jgi:hypothetical protein